MINLCIERIWNRYCEWQHHREENRKPDIIDIHDSVVHLYSLHINL
jgi:hypothetical protein